MLPIRDENPTTIVAWVTLVFIAANIFVYFGTQSTLGGSNTAWEAHVGGFVFGAPVSRLLRSRLVFGSPSRRLAWGVVEAW